jgi:predicted nuclease of predicted toxin-antitoxin system
VSRLPSFKIDENLPEEIAVLLREAGYEAVSVQDQGLAGEPDNVIADMCNAEGLVLVTLDLDFSNIQVYPPDRTSGIMVFRVPHQNKPRLLETLKQALPLLETEQIEQRLWIVEADRVRIRGDE